MINKKKQLVLNLIASIFVFVVQFGLNFWLSPYVVSKLGEEAYGFITLANNFIEYATLITIAINSMASRFISVEYNKGNTDKANKYFNSVFWFNLFVSVVILVISLCFVSKLDNIINIDPSLIVDVKWTFALSFLTLMVSCLSTCFTTTTFVTNRMDYFALIQIGSYIIKFVLIVGMFVILTPHIYYVSFATLISMVVVLLVYVLLRKKLIPEFYLNKQLLIFEYIKELAKSGIWILISNISSIFLNGMDLLLANLFISQTAMSRLSISKQLPSAIGGLLGFLANIFAASFTKYVAENNMKALVKEIHFTFKILGCLLTVPFAGVIVLGKDFFVLWLPQSVYKYDDINEIYILMLLTLANVIINAYMYSVHSLLIALNKVKFYSKLVFGCSVVSIGLTMFFVKFTQLGVFAIAGTSTLVLGLFNLVIVPRYAEYILELAPFTLIRTIFKNYLTLIIICALLYFGRFLFDISSWFGFISFSTIFGAMGYFLCSLILFDIESRRRFLKLIFNKFFRKENGNL